MLLSWSISLSQLTSITWLLISIIVLGWTTSFAHGTNPEEIATLRQESREIFYHGLTNYHKYAYPEDELRPLSCGPLTRDRGNPAHVEVNDVLGNYSLSLVDSLSTLAILASRATSELDDHNALLDFQSYVSLLVEEYGDGSDGQAGQGRRARGFDLDSKVQLFETTIRGVGGLLSAHQFAVGHLPIRGYTPKFAQWKSGRQGVVWNQVETSKGETFVYDGQLLRLAYDLGKRLLPAFHTPTDIPYPRVNLRTGIPFYENSPLNNDPENGQCDAQETPNMEREVTETCSAGAGSLVLEFTVLSRLTGDDRFERLAKKAYWAVWTRRTSTDLIGSGIDAETGQWVGPYTGIGAGIDSFFEYAFKSYILLSGLEEDEESHWAPSSSYFQDVWNVAHAAVKRHIYKGPQYQSVHYAQNDMYTGGPRFAWIDSLSAYYPGLLALAGELEEAESAHLLYTALWHRYGALPERWNTFTGKIDAGLRWWGGRPEFTESTWYLYRATQDPWYLHVGEMTLRDIKRRCWTPCGWAGLQDVRTGEQNDRMESFFLGETAKYLYLLFDLDHPLNHLDAPFVFTTEGHPLIIPSKYRQGHHRLDADPVSEPSQCPIPAQSQSLGGSFVAERPDIFHAAHLARLHVQLPTETRSEQSDPLDLSAEVDGDVSSLQISMNNFTFFPWTLPASMIPSDGTCAPMALRQTFDLTFPALPATLTDVAALQRVQNGILIKSISGLRLSLVLDDDSLHPGEQIYRIYALSNLAMGRDENIWFSPNVISQINPTDPNLSRMKDTDIIDLIIDSPAEAPVAMPASQGHQTAGDAADILTSQLLQLFSDPELEISPLETAESSNQILLRSLPQILLTDTARLADHLDSLAELSIPALNIPPAAFREAAAGLRAQSESPPDISPSTSASDDFVPPPIPTLTQPPQLQRHSFPAMLPSGPGAAPLPSKSELIADPASLPSGGLTFRSVLVLDSDLCDDILPPSIPRSYEILVIRRGGCSFSTKLRAIPAFPPTDFSLKLVVVVSFPRDQAEAENGSRNADAGAEPYFVRPFLDEKQLTPSGTERRNAVPLVLVEGGVQTWGVLERAGGVRGRFEGEKVRVERRNEAGQWAKLDEEEKQGKWAVVNEMEETVEGGEAKSGLAIKRRYWFASNGIRVSNLHIA